MTKAEYLSELYDTIAKKLGKEAKLLAEYTELLLEEGKVKGGASLKKYSISYRGGSTITVEGLGAAAKELNLSANTLAVYLSRGKGRYTKTVPVGGGETMDIVTVERLA